MLPLTASGRQILVGGSPVFGVGFNAYGAATFNAFNQGCGLQFQDFEVDNCMADAVAVAASAGAGTVPMVRCWFFQQFAGTTLPRNWQYLDRIVNSAEAHGVYLIATLGDYNGSCDGHSKAGYPFFATEQNSPQDGNPSSYRDWVTAVVTRYAGRLGIGMWEPMNEGYKNVDIQTAVTHIQQVTQQIKAIAPTMLISSGTTGDGFDQAGTEYTDFHSVAGIDVCSLHVYGSAPDRVQGSTTVTDGATEYPMQRIVRAAKLNKPIICGEFKYEVALDTGTLAAYRQAGCSAFLIWYYDPQHKALPGIPPIPSGVLASSAHGLTDTNCWTGYGGASVTVNNGTMTISGTNGAGGALLSGPPVTAVIPGKHLNGTLGVTAGSGSARLDLMILHADCTLSRTITTGPVTAGKTGSVPDTVLASNEVFVQIQIVTLDNNSVTVTA